LNFSDQKLKEVRFHETLATHRNILKIIHAWEERERLYIQTELCQNKYGKSLEIK
jgi:membrane-associated tyrosine/threonine-specific cdc2-inhibitory kinase